MNVLVTGAAGFIGSHLAERLVDLGHSVRGIDCLTDFYAKSLKELNAAAVARKGVIVLPVDLAEDDLAPAIRDIDVVYHLAAQPGIAATTSFQAYVKNNIVATYRLLEALRQSAALRTFIYVSTSSVYGADATGSETSEPKPTSHYGVTKLAAEQLVMSHARDRGMPACAMRLFSVYGPRERPEKLYPQLIRSILEDREFPLHQGSEQHVRSFTYIADIVDGLIAVLDNAERCQGEIFNIGTDVAISTGDGMRIISEIIGKPLRIARRGRRAGDQLRTHANIDKARRLLGYNPTTTIHDGLENEVRWYRQHILGKIDLWPVPHPLPV